MTLNLTLLGPPYVVQVSDRRLTYVTTSGSIVVDEDDANKAVVLSCSDSLLAITFTGLGRLYTTRVDEWLLNVLLEEALCEMEAAIAVERFSELATDWFQSFRATWTGPHTFIFAGFSKKPDSEESRSLVWFVTNSTSVDYSSFAVSSESKDGLYVTGYLPAFTRTDRRRIQAACRKAKNIEVLEAALVAGIRSAASQPNGGPIGKNCMSISLARSRTAISRFHPLGENPHNFAPHFLWYERGRNYAVRGIDHLSSGQYSIVFGGNAGALMVRPGPGIGLPQSNKAFARFHVKFTNARYHSEPVVETTIAKIVADRASGVDCP